MVAKQAAKVRVLRRMAGNQAVEELRSRGADIAAIRQIAPRLESLAVIVPGLEMSAAVGLRQEAKAAGVQAILCRSSIRARGQEMSDVIVTASAVELQKFGEDLKMTEVGAALSAAVERWSKPRKRNWRCAGRSIALGEKTLVMGILNATPDSFSGDGFGSETEAGLRRAKEMVEAGADLLDVGGESSRPGAEPVTEEEELRRVVPLIERIAKELATPISVDTTKARVAREALAAGACIVNDISALRFDEAMVTVVAEAQAGVVLMHMLGSPRDMQEAPAYTDLLAEIYSFLSERAEFAEKAGIGAGQITVDPGFGFGKTVEHNLEILRRLEELCGLGFPLLVGTSRKSTIGKVLETEADDRLEGTAATVALAIAGGADIVRVHDVKEMARTAKMADAVLRVKHPEPKEDEYVSWGKGEA